MIEVMMPAALRAWRKLWITLLAIRKWWWRLDEGRIFADMVAMSLERDGTMSVRFEDGRSETASLGQQVFAATSMIESSTYLVQSSRLRLCTTRGDDIVLDVPKPTDLAPLRGRPTIYLDQNHWSTLAHTIYEPERVSNEGEHDAAAQRSL